MRVKARRDGRQSLRLCICLRRHMRDAWTFDIMTVLADCMGRRDSNAGMKVDESSIKVESEPLR